MLVSEISVVAAAGGLLVALLSCLMVMSARRKMNVRMDEMRLELEVHLSASHQMAKHIRILQQSMAATAPLAQGEAQAVATASETDAAEDHRSDRDQGLSLAEKLGLSQSEADIITHLRPRKRLKESA